MLRLTSILYPVIATALAGSGVIAVLLMGYDTLMPILWAVLAGAVIAAPISWIVAGKISYLK